MIEHDGCVVDRKGLGEVFLVTRWLAMIEVSERSGFLQISQIGYLSAGSEILQSLELRYPAIWCTYLGPGLRYGLF